jgi:hypothetical protein
MTRMNLDRVVLGGLLAGLVIYVGETLLSVLVLPQAMPDLLKTRNLPELGGAAIGGFVSFGLLLGIVRLWLYAAPPRFGAGPGTAAIAGLFVGFLAYVYKAAATALMGFYPINVALAGAMCGLLEIVLASVAGAGVYAE